jgi:hypothetical protein
MVGSAKCESRKDDANLGWIRDFYTAMYGPDGPVPDGTMDGCYVKYPDVDLTGWQHLYYKYNHARLQEAEGLGTRATSSISGRRSNCPRRNDARRPPGGGRRGLRRLWVGEV